MSTELQQLATGQNNAEVVVNELIESLSAAGIFSKAHETTTGLTWGYYGGLYLGNTVADGTVTLTDDDDNWIVVNRSTGVVSVSTSGTNAADTAYAAIYKVTAASGVVTTVVDLRMDDNGLLAGDTGSGGGSSAAGRHAVYISAGAMKPSVSGGCAAMNWIATAADQPDVASLDFDASTAEYAQFSMAMPKSWNEGTVTFKPVWSHAATTTNFGVVWQLQAVAIGNDDQIPVAYGTAQSSTDTGGTTDDLYVGPESSAITIAGTPAAEDVVFFRVSRLPSDGSDTMAIDARLHGVILYITTDAENDA